MTPKEKALQLVHRYVDLTDGWVYGTKNWEHKKQCALIAVNEIILEQCKSSEKKDARYQDERLMYWQQVKEEIEKL